MMLNIKQLLLYIGLLLCVLLQVCRSKTPQYCPAYCTCDLYEERNRALCSAKRLISANVEVPKAVEILDLSYNDITGIDNGSLQNYVHLVNLTLAHNAISTIYTDAFGSLRSLQAIDLAYNRLEYVDEHLLESNRRLRYVNLEGNKFMSITGDHPLLRSTTLRILNLRNAQISQVSGEMLSALPQLEELDLSQNLLITLNAAAFNAPRQLSLLDLNENPLNCDQMLLQMIDVLRKRAMIVNISDCEMTKKVAVESDEELLVVDDALEEQPMFERMQLRDSESKNKTKTKSEQVEIEVDEPLDIQQVWRVLPDSEEAANDEDKTDSVVCEGEREKLCQRYRSCLERVSHMLFEQEEGAREFLEKTHTYTEDDVKLAFIIGGATGICVVIFIITCALCLKSCCELKRKRAEAQVEETENSPITVLNVSLPHTVETPAPILPPPVPSRTRQPRRSNPTRRQQQQLQTQSRALARQRYGPEDSFFSRLFGRPARHQYYRTINQNTATLIRRLSRSNLFNNRFTERDQNSPTTPTSPTPTARFYDSFDDVPLTIDSHPAHTRTAAVATPQRPETPPPNYGDVVIDNCDRK